MKFHEKLFGLRKQAGMTQSDLAEKLNVSRQAVSRWEMGTAMPEIDTLIAISDLFDASLDYLLRDKTEQMKEEPAEPLPAMPRYWDFVPKLWWLPAVIAVFFRVFPSVILAINTLFSEFSVRAGDWLNERKNAVMLTVFNPVLWNALYTLFLSVTVLCFMLALRNWLRAKK